MSSQVKDRRTRRVCPLFLLTLLSVYHLEVCYGIVENRDHNQGFVLSDRNIPENCTSVLLRNGSLMVSWCYPNLFTDYDPDFEVVVQSKISVDHPNVTESVFITNKCEEIFHGLQSGRKYRFQISVGGVRKYECTTEHADVQKLDKEASVLDYVSQNTQKHTWATPHEPSRVPELRTPELELESVSEDEGKLEMRRSAENGPRAVRAAPNAPGKPRSLRSTRVTNTTIEVEWKSNGPADGFTVVFTPDPRKPPAGPWTTKEPRFEAKDLTPGMEYIISVRAFKNNGGGAEKLESDEASIRQETEVGVPSAPATMTFSFVNSTQIVVSWSKPKEPNGPINHYLLRWTWDTSRHGSDSPEGHETSCVVPRLTPYKEYNFTLEACNQIEEKSFCGESVSKVSRTHTAEPGKPEVQKEAMSVSERSIRGEWMEPKPKNGPLDGYIIHIRPCFGTGEGSITRETKKTWWEENKLTPCACYTYAVQAYNIDTRDNVTKLFGAEDLTTVETSEAPGKPRSLENTDTRSTTLSFKWMSPDKPGCSVDGYKIVLASERERDVPVVEENTTRTQFTAERLSPKTTYIITVSAFHLRKSDNKDLQSPGQLIKATTSDAVYGTVGSLLLISVCVFCSGLRQDWSCCEQSEKPRADGLLPRVDFRSAGDAKPEESSTGKSRSKRETDTDLHVNKNLLV